MKSEAKPYAHDCGLQNNAKISWTDLFREISG